MQGVLGNIYLYLAENLGGAERDRTADLHVANVALSQLSYGPKVISICPSFSGGVENVSRIRPKVAPKCLQCAYGLAGMPLGGYTMAHAEQQEGGLK
jgi:hypothetical protein